MSKPGFDDAVCKSTVDAFTPIDTDLELITDCPLPDFSQKCIDSGIPPKEMIENMASKKLSSLMHDMTKVKVLLVLAQYYACWKHMEELKQNEQVIEMIKHDLEEFLGEYMIPIRDFVQHANGFARRPANAFPNPWNGPVNEQFLDRALNKLDYMLSQLEKAVERARTVRWQALLNAGFSLLKIGHSAWIMMRAAADPNAMIAVSTNVAQIGLLPSTEGMWCVQGSSPMPRTYNYSNFTN